MVTSFETTREALENDPPLQSIGRSYKGIQFYRNQAVVNLYLTFRNQLIEMLAPEDQQKYVQSQVMDIDSALDWCHTCGKLDVDLVCAACAEVYYCSRACQQEHWEYEHQDLCCSS